MLEYPVLDLADFDLVTSLFAAASLVALWLLPPHDVRGCPDALWESLDVEAAE